MFDPKCYELAEHFLPADASEERKRELAQDIQVHIELMLFVPEKETACGDLVTSQPR